jgi:hypothetical protein
MIINCGLTTIFDLDFLDEFSKYRWNLQGGYVGACNIGNYKYNEYTVKMHRLAMILSGHNINGLVVDHINRDKFDNRVVNLRVCTKAQNTRNKIMNYRNKTGFYGVSIFNSNRYKIKKIRYKAQITYNGKAIYLGVFDDPVEAAKAYNKKAKKFGFYNLNDV